MRTVPGLFSRRLQGLALFLAAGCVFAAPMVGAETIQLKEETQFSIFRNGKAVGHVLVPAGSEVEVVSRNGDQIIVKRGGFQATIGPAAVSSSEPASADAPANSAPGGSPIAFYQNYCIECHSADESKGDFNIEPMLAEPVKDHLADWHEVLDQIDLESMPPSKAKQPTPHERAKAVERVEIEIAAALGETGRLARRLNRAQYNNTIRDLTGIDISPADAFPQDLGREGFDNVSEAQSVSPFLLEKYFEAAGQVLDYALIDVDEPERIHTFHYPLSRDMRDGKIPIKAGEVDMTIFVGVKNGKPLHDFLEKTGTDLRPLSLNYSAGGAKNTREGKGKHGYEVVMDHNGRAGSYASVGFRNELPLGKYRVKVRAYSELANDRDGNTVERSGPSILGIDVNGQRVREIDVPVTDEPQTYEVEFTTDREKSSVTLAAATVRDRSDLKGIPNLVLCDVEFEGPLYDAWPPAPTREILGDSEEWTYDDVLERFVSRAFRRPATPDEVRKYREIAEEEEAAGADRVDALRLALQAVLVSPNFLFLIEESRPEGDLNPFELATRLSYFLWESMPDDELFGLAASGQLSDPDVLRQQVHRMVMDPRAESFVRNFTGQWLGVRRVADVAPDPKVFPQWDEALRKAMAEEPERFFDHVLRENLSVLTFLDSDFTFLNERLADHYGIEGIEGAEFQKVSLPADSPRGGVLTQAGILTVASQPTRSSPVFRGVFVVEKLFNRPPPNPPAQVPDLPEEELIEEPQNLRETLAAHVADPSCASCHEKIDPWGLPLESFDGIGQWREMDEDDLWSVLPNNQRITGVAGLKEQLMTQREFFLRGLTEKLLLYSLGRTLNLNDKDAVDKILREAEQSDFRFQNLLAEIVTSKPFRTR